MSSSISFYNGAVMDRSVGFTREPVIFCVSASTYCTVLYISAQTNIVKPSVDFDYRNYLEKFAALFVPPQKLVCDCEQSREVAVA